MEEKKKELLEARKQGRAPREVQVLQADGSATTAPPKGKGRAGKGGRSEAKEEEVAEGKGECCVGEGVEGKGECCVGEGVEGKDECCVAEGVEGKDECCGGEGVEGKDECCGGGGKGCKLTVQQPPLPRRARAGPAGAQGARVRPRRR